jgi:hypothetical protein
MTQTVPSVGVLSGMKTSVRWAAVHIPYVLPGETRALTPLYSEAYQGGWQQGVEIYRKWQASWLKMPPLPAWVAEPHSWQQIQLNNPEDKEGVNYTAFRQVGETAYKWGVKAIQVTGWHIGGQDQNYPNHTIDARLGTWQDFKDSIEATQKLGVKVTP